jgi:hypothetical protein
VDTFLVEQFWPGVTPTDFKRAAERVRASADSMAGDGTAIRFLHSTLVPRDEASFCVLEAASSSLVAEAYRRAGVGYDRILEALEG